jgi:hypothetical protein
VKTSPTQLAAVGVTRYVAVTNAAEVLNNCPVILFTPVAWAAPPVNPDPAGAVQVYVVLKGTIPSVPLEGDRVNVTPEQTEIAIGWMAAFGCKLTTNVNCEPVHIPETGVT